MHSVCQLAESLGFSDLYTQEQCASPLALHLIVRPIPGCFVRGALRIAQRGESNFN
jgi:hypothetical protein